MAQLWAFRAASASVASGANPTPALPSGHVKGDLLVLIAASTTTAYSATPPTGYTQLLLGAAGPNLSIWYKFDGGSESAPALTNSDTTCRATLLDYHFVGALDLLGSVGSGASLTATTVSETTTATDDLVLSIFAVVSGATRTLSLPGSTTSRINSSASTTLVGLRVADEDQAATGASAARASALGGSGTPAWQAVTLSFKQGAAVSGSVSEAGSGADQTDFAWAVQEAGAAADGLGVSVVGAPTIFRAPIYQRVQLPPPAPEFIFPNVTLYKGQTVSDSVTESSAPTDALDATHAVAGPVSETGSALETAAASWQAADGLAESSSGAETTDATYGVAVAEAGSGADTAAAGLVAAAAEAGSAADSANGLLGNVNPVSETDTPTETVAATAAWQAAVSELTSQADVEDVSSQALVGAVSEAASGSDSAAVKQALLAAASEAGAGSETTAATYRFALAVAEAGSAAETSTGQLQSGPATARAPFFQPPLIVPFYPPPLPLRNSALYSVQQLTVSATEATLAADATVGALLLAAAIAEVASAADSAAVAVTYAAAIAEAGALGDTTTGAAATSVNEAVATADTLASSIFSSGTQPPLTWSQPLPVAPNLVYLTSQFDLRQAMPWMLASQVTVLAAAEAMSATDGVSAQLVTAVVALTEAVVPLEAGAAALTQPAAASEAAAPADAAAAGQATAAAAAEATAPSEIISAVLLTAGAVTEATTPAEATASTSAPAGGVVEATAASDGADSSVGYVSSVAELLAATADQIVVVQYSPIDLVEEFAAADLLVGSLPMSAALAERLFPRDTASLVLPPRRYFPGYLLPLAGGPQPLE